MTEAEIAGIAGWIAQAGLDVLWIATPGDLHYPIAMAGLDAGLHVQIGRAHV